MVVFVKYSPLVRFEVGNIRTLLKFEVHFDERRVHICAILLMLWIRMIVTTLV